VGGDDQKQNAERERYARDDRVRFRNSVRSLTDALGWLPDSFPLP
jgi:hypothetical protein